MNQFSIIIIALSICIGFILQCKTGNINLSLISFPVNITLLIALIGTTFVFFKEKSQHPKLQEWASAQTSLLLLGSLCVCCFFIALVPRWEVQQSWPFNLLMGLLFTNLLLAIFRYKGPYRKRFYLNHLGLFLFMSALACGSADMHRWRAVITVGETIDKAYDQKGILHTLGYPLKLESLKVTYYENQTPQSFDAKVSSEGMEQNILVNYPWHKSWKEDIYIVNYGRFDENGKEYCVLEFINQPWKHIATLGIVLTASGAFLLLWGKKTKKRTL